MSSLGKCGEGERGKKGGVGEGFLPDNLPLIPFSAFRPLPKPRRQTFLEIPKGLSLVGRWVRTSLGRGRLWMASERVGAVILVGGTLELLPLEDVSVEGEMKHVDA